MSKNIEWFQSVSVPLSYTERPFGLAQRWPWDTRRLAIHTGHGPLQSPESLDQKGTSLFDGLSGKVWCWPGPSLSGQEKDQVAAAPSHFCCRPSCGIVCGIGRVCVDTCHCTCPEQLEASHSGNDASGERVIAPSLSLPQLVKASKQNFIPHSQLRKD